MHSDGSALAHVDHQARTCDVCAQPLSTGGTWYVTVHPRGVHTRCRDWTRVPFPFARHLDELGRIERKPETPPAARAICLRAARAFAAHRRAWPGGGAPTVEACLRIVSAAKARLRACGVDAKTLSKF